MWTDPPVPIPRADTFDDMTVGSADPEGQVEVCATEADVARILEEERGPDVRDDVGTIKIGIDASEDEVRRSGVPGARAGGKLTLEQGRRLHELFKRLNAAFAQYPPANNAKPIVVESLRGARPFHNSQPVVSDADFT